MYIYVYIYIYIYIIFYFINLITISFIIISHQMYLYHNLYILLVQCKKNNNRVLQKIYILVELMALARSNFDKMFFPSWDPNNPPATVHLIYLAINYLCVRRGISIASPLSMNNRFSTLLAPSMFLTKTHTHHVEFHLTNFSTFLCQFAQRFWGTKEQQQALNEPASFISAIWWTKACSIMRFPAFL